MLRRSPSTFLSSGEPCNLTHRSRSCQPPPNIFFRIFFQRRAAVPGGLCADWVGLANPRFPGSKCVVGKTNIRIRLKGVNPLRSRGPICQKSVCDYTPVRIEAQAQRRARHRSLPAPHQQQRRLAAPDSLAWKIGSSSARLTMKRRPGFNRWAVNDHFRLQVASAAVPNRYRRSIAPPTDPIYLFACHAAQGRSRACTPADPAVSSPSPYAVTTGAAAPHRRRAFSALFRRTPHQQERRLAAPDSLAWKIGSSSARLTMKRRPGLNRGAVNDHFSPEVASAAAPNQHRGSIAPPTDPIYLFACHAAQGRSRACTPADPAVQHFLQVTAQTP